MKDFNANRLLNRYWDRDASAIRYLRPGGDNANDGTTPATAWAGDASGLKKALEWQAVVSTNRSQIIDLTGCSITLAEQLNLGTGSLGGASTRYDFAETGPNNFLSREICQLRSELTQVVSPITITGVTPDGTSGLYTTVNVANALTPNAHRGQFLVGSGYLEYAAIQSNGAGTLSLCTTVDPQTWTAPIGIYDTGATITAGDDADPFSNATVLQALCGWSLSGIHFASTANAKATALDLQGPGPYVAMQLCHVDGLGIGEGSAYALIDACFLDGNAAANALGINGMSYILRSSYLYQLDNIFHASSTYSDLIDCIVEGGTAWGGGVSLSRFNFNAQNCNFLSNTTGGVQIKAGPSAMSNCVCSNNTGAGVTVTDGAHAVLSNVDGTGNSTYGIALTNGAFARVLNGCAVTGTSGNVLLGGAGAVAYAALPSDDLGAAAGTRQGVIARTT